MLLVPRRYISHRFNLITTEEYDMPSSSRSNGSVTSSFTSRYNNPELVEDLAGLVINTEQRDAIVAFVQATNQSVDVAIETLQECGWDFLKAIPQSGGDDERDDIPHDSTEQEEEDDGIEPIRPQARWRYQELSPEPRRRSRESTPSNIFLLKALERATAKSRKDHPRSYKFVVAGPIAVGYAPLGLWRTPAPMFIPSYQDKLWYTGFMKP